MISYKLNKKIKDDQLNVDRLSLYDLSIQVSKDTFKICVTDSEKSRCVLLEDYSFFNINSGKDLIQQLENIFDDHHVLKANFWKSIKLVIRQQGFSLVPVSLFDENFVEDFLQFNYSKKTDEDRIYYYRQQSLDAMNIFVAEKEVVEWFEKAYPGRPITLVHSTSPLIEGLLKNYSNKEERSIYINIDGHHLTLLVIENRKLEFCNTFHFLTTDDFVYYVLFIFDQLQLNPEHIPVTIWGDLSIDSPIYRRLLKYVRFVSLGKRPSSLYFSYNFDEIFDHTFFDLYNMHLCE